jgi:hypothetical protein
MFQDIEELHRRGDGYVLWRGICVEHYTPAYSQVAGGTAQMCASVRLRMTPEHMRILRRTTTSSDGVQQQRKPGSGPKVFACG